MLFILTVLRDIGCAIKKRGRNAYWLYRAWRLGEPYFSRHKECQRAFDKADRAVANLKKGIRQVEASLDKLQPQADRLLKKFAP